MSVEVLVAAMNQPKDDFSLLKKLNIQSDVIVGNQCDRNEIRYTAVNGYKAIYLNFKEKGVGLNRNNALMRSQGDYCLFADDDMRYVDEYPILIEEQFEKYPNADVIIFNLIERDRKRYVIKKPFKVHYYNFMRFGAVRIAIKRQSIINNGISFNLTFGGGTEHSNGEDTLFLADCLKNNLNIYAVPIFIAELTEERSSSWFQGYNNKYFKDKGILYYRISRKWYKFLCLQDAIRHQKLYKKKWLHIYKLMTKNEDL